MRLTLLSLLLASTCVLYAQSSGTVEKETQKLEAIKTHKKGLMQELFPSPEEVAR